jgi:hypothetical protein
VTHEPRDWTCPCGSPVPSGRPGRWCSSWCRGREDQGLPAQPPPGLAPSPPQAPPTPVAPPAPVAVSPGRARPSVVDRVTATLEAVGLAGTWEAAAALDLAESLDDGGGSGSARAALHKELRATMTAALRGVDDPATRVGGMRNELAERRARRAGGTG